MSLPSKSKKDWAELGFELVCEVTRNASANEEIRVRLKYQNKIIADWPVEIFLDTNNLSVFNELELWEVLKQLPEKKIEAFITARIALDWSSRICKEIARELLNNEKNSWNI